MEIWLFPVHNWPTLRRCSSGSRKKRSPSYEVPLYREGEPAETLFILQAGLIKLTGTVEGHTDVLLRIVRAGELFGDQVLLGDTRRASVAEALCDSIVREISRREMLSRCRRQPELWDWLVGRLERRIEEVERRVALISFFRVEQRILFLLSDLAMAYPPGVLETNGAEIPLSQSEIASLVGATRETTSTVLNSLERRGALSLGRRHILVRSPAVLRGIALGETNSAHV